MSIGYNRQETHPVRQCDPGIIGIDGLPRKERDAGVLPDQDEIERIDELLLLVDDAKNTLMMGRSNTLRCLVLDGVRTGGDISGMTDVINVAIDKSRTPGWVTTLAEMLRSASITLQCHRPF